MNLIEKYPRISKVLLHRAIADAGQAEVERALSVSTRIDEQVSALKQLIDESPARNSKAKEITRSVLNAPSASVAAAGSLGARVAALAEASARLSAGIAPTRTLTVREVTRSILGQAAPARRSQASSGPTLAQLQVAADELFGPEQRVRASEDEQLFNLHARLFCAGLTVSGAPTEELEKRFRPPTIPNSRVAALVREHQQRLDAILSSPAAPPQQPVRHSAPSDPKKLFGIDRANAAFKLSPD